MQIMLELLTGLPPYDEERDGNDLVKLFRIFYAILVLTIFLLLLRYLTSMPHWITKISNNY